MYLWQIMISAALRLQSGVLNSTWFILHTVVLGSLYKIIHRIFSKDFSRRYFWVAFTIFKKFLNDYYMNYPRIISKIQAKNSINITYFLPNAARLGFRTFSKIQPGISPRKSSGIPLRNSQWRNTSRPSLVFFFYKFIQCIFHLFDLHLFKIWIRTQFSKDISRNYFKDFFKRSWWNFTDIILGISPQIYSGFQLGFL